MLKFTLVILLLTLQGCQSPSYNKMSSQNKQSSLKVSQKLYAEYNRWRRTPYKYGGYTFKGVDCSGLVQSIFRDAFGLKVPRTTKQQVKLGSFVTKSQAIAGDIIFFKTGWNSRHSGIVVDKGRFIHSSTNKGVIISNIDNPYWKDQYWQTRRILK